MEIRQAINEADKLVPNNVFTDTEKKSWLSKLDRQIKLEIIDIRDGAAAGNFKDYDDNTPEATMLLVPSPYDELYIFYLKAQMHIRMDETDRYNAAVLMYKDLLSQYRNYYNRTHSTVNVPLNI